MDIDLDFIPTAADYADLDWFFHRLDQQEDDRANYSAQEMIDFFGQR